MDKTTQRLQTLISRAQMLLRTSEQVDINDDLSAEIGTLAAGLTDISNIVLYAMSTNGFFVPALALLNGHSVEVTSQEIDKGRDLCARRHVQKQKRLMPAFTTQPERQPRLATSEEIRANFAVPIITLNLSARVTNIIGTAGIVSIGILLGNSERQIRDIPKLGNKGVQEILDILARRGWLLHKG